MPKFNKSLDELETHFDKWLYVIKNLNKLDRIPNTLRERIFEKLFDAAEIANFTTDQVRSYQDSLKYYRDIKNSIDTARDEGKFEEKIEIAQKAMAKGFSAKDVAELTGLSEEEIEKLKY